MEKSVNLILLVFVGIFMLGFGSAFSGDGSGTLADPWVITNCTQLQEMNESLAGNYSLGNDIDCSNTSVAGESIWDESGFNPIGDAASTSFSGNFNGSYHVISNLFINRSDEDYVGLFGSLAYCVGGFLVNVGLENVSLVGRDYVGGFVGYYFTECSNFYNISFVYVSGNVSGNNRVGGIFGNFQGNASNSFFVGNVSGNDYIGGVFGGLALYGSSVNHIYSNSNVVNISVNSGGLIAGISGSGDSPSISYSYYNNETSEKSDDDGRGEPKTTLEMQTQSTYIGWDFENIWGMNAVYNNGYPILRAFGYDLSLPVTYLFPQTNSTSTNRTFIFNVSDDSDIANCSLYIYDSGAVSYSGAVLNSSVINKSANNSITYDMAGANSADNFTAYVNCTDVYGFVGQSNTIAFEITEEATTAEETTTSSGGSSSGPISYTASESSLQNGITRNFRKGDALKFKSNNESHNVTVNSISNETISITVYSTPQSFTMKLGDILNVDLDNDGIKDIEISYLKYLTSIVSLKVRAIELPYETPKNETSEVPSGEEKISEEDIKSFGRNLIIGLAVVLLIVLVAIAVLFVRLMVKRRKKRK